MLPRHLDLISARVATSSSECHGQFGCFAWMGVWLEASAIWLNTQSLLAAFDFRLRQLPVRQAPQAWLFAMAAEEISLAGQATNGSSALTHSSYSEHLA